MNSQHPDLDPLDPLDLDSPLWGAAAIAPVIRRSVRATFHLLENGELDADKVGGRWVSTPRRALSKIVGGYDPSKLRPRSFRRLERHTKQEAPHEPPSE